MWKSVDNIYQELPKRRFSINRIEYTDIYRKGVDHICKIYVDILPKRSNMLRNTEQQVEDTDIYRKIDQIYRELPKRKEKLLRNTLKNIRYTERFRTDQID